MRSEIAALHALDVQSAMSGHSTPSTRSIPQTYGGSPFDASGVANPDAGLDMTGASPGARQYFDQPIFEYHAVPELREDASPHSNPHHHGPPTPSAQPQHGQQQQPTIPQQQPPVQQTQTHPERRLSGQIPVIAGALRGMRVRTGCRSGSISKKVSGPNAAVVNANRRSLDLSAVGFTLDVKNDLPAAVAPINTELDVSGMLSLANVAVGHHEGISPTSNPPVSPNGAGLASRRHRTQPAVLPLSSPSQYLSPTAADSPSQLKVPGSALISPTGAAVTQFQGLALAPISPAPRSSISFESRIDPPGYERLPTDTAMGNGVNGSNGVTFSSPPKEPSAPLPLSEHEAELFKNFVNRICPWLDIFDFDRRFTLMVPRLARKSTGLLNACLALSAKQQYRLRATNEPPMQDPNPEIEFSQYYDAALREMQNSLVQDVDGTFSSSEEFLATTVILSTFEIIDGSNSEFKKHLEGVGSIIKPQGIHESLEGLKGAAFWAWYRQDVLAAFRERRATFITEDYWHLDTTPDTMCMLREDELCNRVMFILGQIINYCAKDEIEKNEQNVAERIQKAEFLEKKLDDWKRCLPDTFEPLTRMRDKDSIFDTLWFNPPCCGVALQIYCFAKIMLTMHKPHPPSQDRYQHFLAAQRQYKQSSAMIIGISLSGCEETYHLLSLQCLYAAGLVLDGKEERKILLGLINECQHRTGRSTYYLSEELRKLWQEGETS
ncbi:hypothetical protein ABW21_db0204958 [Orbilia brochopaga]|nr:hypothetical protein ABW21_db0204958 [Drechslerella brochopaga]